MPRCDFSSVRRLIVSMSLFGTSRTSRDVRSCLIDGEAVACDESGLAVFERLRRKRAGEHVFLYAFDLVDRLLRHVDQIPAYTKESEGAGTWAIAEPGA
jgi:hypothetical protein